VKSKAKTIVPALAKSLGDKEADNRLCALFALMKFGKDARESLPAIKMCLRDKDDTVRLWAVQAVGKIAVPDEATAKALIPLLDLDEHPDVTGAAIDVLGTFGEKAAEAIPHLERIGRDIRFRGDAALAISRIKGK
jgi:HEAT repeat protein